MDGWEVTDFSRLFHLKSNRWNEINDTEESDDNVDDVDEQGTKPYTWGDNIILNIILLYIKWMSVRCFSPVSDNSV